MSALRLPPPLAPGGLVHVVAPSGPVDRTRLFRGLGWLAKHYRLRWSRRLLERDGYLAGTDERRLDELQTALDDRESAVVAVARGGFGASRIAHQLNFAAFREEPSWLVGFSDVTALHLELARHGICSLHAPNVTDLGREDHRTRSAWRRALERPGEGRTFGDLSVVEPGAACGTLAGGNLTLMSTSAAAGRLRLPAPCVLFMEEVNERPYRIDRMLTSLVLGRHLDGVAAVAVGDLSGCSPPGQPHAALQAIRRALQPLRVPILFGLPVGHRTDNQPLLLGARAHLCSERRRLVVESTS